MLSDEDISDFADKKTIKLIRKVMARSKVYIDEARKVFEKETGDLPKEGMEDALGACLGIMYEQGYKVDYESWLRAEKDEFMYDVVLIVSKFNAKTFTINAPLRFVERCPSFDGKLIEAIVKRSVEMFEKFEGADDKALLFAYMLPMVLIDRRFRIDLKKFLEFDDFNFIHDVVGIINHFDPDAKTITRGFLPRCAVYANEIED